MLYAILFLCSIQSVTCLNYFWLSWDPAESARWYCDQHCFKIGSEVVESIWDVILAICPELSAKADILNITTAFRRRRHSRDNSLWHPLSVWHGLCFANMHRGLINANAIFEEHFRRTGTKHLAWRDCLFLLENISMVNFASLRWKRWYLSQNGEEGTRYTPAKTKRIHLSARREWCSVHALNIIKMDRNSCKMTEPPQCIPLECKVPGDVVGAYKKYYQTKIYTMGIMRFYHRSPLPPWVFGYVVKDAKKIKIIPYALDDDGYVLINFV